MDLDHALGAQLVAEAPSLQRARSRYKAKIASVSPPAMRTQFETEDACFLGVSLENAHFTRPKLEAMLEWVAKRFRRCTLLVGDSIHRITLESTRGYGPQTALREALALGDRFITHNDDLVGAFRNRILFRYETCSAVQRSADYARYHAELRTQFASDEAFRLSVQSFAQRYHRRTWDVVDEETRARRLERSCDYFLEEFAVFACLRRRGLGVMVYPGAFSTLEEIARGRHPDTCPELRGLTIVSLQIKRR
ncbi:tRNA-dependent cyclodipeptide synthase [Salinarimonas chemoclinalis]|uniref:tRNA-dependent cyclodipeptide synthase n=1 Tax=Salinarimonas chemoclinalis TaxID=3241599 RepID=UPI003556F403